MSGEELRAALSDAFDAMDAACRWAANEATNLRTPEAADRHLKGYDALLDATVKAGQAAGRLSGGAALAAPSTPEPSGLPERVVVGANGAYWRDYGTHYSMCPVSEDNDPVEVTAVYVRSRATVVEEWARSALRAAPSTEPALDVERLARALRATFDLGHQHENMSDSEPCFECPIDAEHLAAEYARLAESQP